jgi:hypothetical protein
LADGCNASEGEKMTNEQTMKLMEELGLHDGGVDNWYSDNAWVKFARLVAEHEREACAALCFQMWNKWLDSEDRSEFTRPDAEDCAAAIRARGQV